MARLTSQARRKLPKSDFVFPKERAYPIPDKSHARNALARVAQHGSPAMKKKVRREVEQDFPSIDVKGKALKKKTK